jgi:hypothetical protein
MTPLALDLMLLAVSAFVLFMGFRRGTVAIHSGGVERSKQPVLFWSVMCLAAVLAVAAIGMAIAGR